MHQRFHFQRKGFQKGTAAADLGCLAGTRAPQSVLCLFQTPSGLRPARLGGRPTYFGQSEADGIPDT